MPSAGSRSTFASRSAPTASRVPTRRRRAASVAGLALREGEAAHGRAARADLFTDPREPPRPVGDRFHPRTTAATGDPGDRRQADRLLDGAEMPFLGGKVVKPLATDLSAWQLLQLGWSYFRAGSGKALHCRLGGDGQTIGGQSVIVGSEDNANTIAMFMGRSAPLPPLRRSFRTHLGARSETRRRERSVGLR